MQSPFGFFVDSHVGKVSHCRRHTKIKAVFPNGDHAEAPDCHHHRAQAVNRLCLRLSGTKRLFDEMVGSAGEREAQSDNADDEQLGFRQIASCKTQEWPVPKVKGIAYQADINECRMT